MNFLKKNYKDAILVKKNVFFICIYTQKLMKTKRKWQIL